MYILQTITDNVITPGERLVLTYLPVCIFAVKGAPVTSSLLKVMLMMWSIPSKGTKLTTNLAEP